jgi:glycosyltransferase involved in cell wall biosynthesis
LGRKTGGAGDLFPRIHKEFKEKSSIPRRLRRGFFIDPMSRNNLGEYDKNLLENIHANEIVFFTSSGFQYDNVNNTRTIIKYNYHKLKGIKKILSYVKSQISLLCFVFVYTPDIIHFQWFKIPLFDLLVLFVIKLLKSDIKLINTAHNTLPHDTGNKYFYCYYIIYHLLDGIIVHTENTKKEINNMFGVSSKFIAVIPHGLLGKNTVPFKKCNSKIIFSMTGVLQYYKGVDILLDAWTKNIKITNNDSIHLIIAGLSAIPIDEIYSGKNITILNRFITNEEYIEITNLTDIGILPYRRISQSGVLLTLLANHKSVIVSNCGGLVEPFNIGNVGWVIPELSAASLSNIIINIANNPELIFKMQSDSILWDKIDKYYSWERIGKLTLEFYNYLMKNE